MAKLLLVEDDNNLREIYQARLAAEGYEIVSAQDGEEALVVAKQQKPDLVISDVMMPKISGFEMLDILRNTPGLENVRVIMLTALSQGEDRERADSLGADKYLVKSQVTLEDIVKTARALLEGDESSDEAAAATLAAAGAAQADPSVESPTGPTTTLAAADPVATPPPVEEPVAPAPAEPVAPAPAPDPTPSATAMPPADPTASAAVDDNTDDQSANALVDDQLVVDAVNELTKGDATKPDEEPVATTEEEPVEPKAATGGNRVIQPLQSEPKSSLDELVAQEEANEAEADAAAAAATPEPAPAPTPGPESVETPPAPEPAATPEQPRESETPAEQDASEPPQAPPAPAKENKDGIDPNSIAL